MEKIVVQVVVDGIELQPVELGEGRQDHFYEDNIVFFKMGNLFNKEHTAAPYTYMVRLERRKTEEEKTQR